MNNKKGDLATKNFSQDLIGVLKKTFGFSCFKDGQELIVQNILEHNDILAVMPTGYGKSLCYQFPAVIQKNMTIVVSPLIALMNDQVSYLKNIGIRAETFNSENTFDQGKTIFKKILNKEVKILYLSPEKLMQNFFLEFIKTNNILIDLFVIDEAHCLAKWGPDFRKDYERLSELKDLFPKSTIASFTATADVATRNEINEKLNSGNGKVFVREFDRPNLSLSVISKDEWRKKLISFLKKKEGMSGIVYVLSRKDSEKVSDFINANGFKSLPYHAGLDTTTKQNNQDQFMTTTGLIIVATVAFGMGIDKSDIRFVYHLNLPQSMEAFYQEIGRAGRDGNAAETILFFGVDDLIKRRRMIDDSNAANDFKIREHKRLDYLHDYCESSKCRRISLLTYFGDENVSCDNCDNCINPPEEFDATQQSQIILSVIKRLDQIRQKFGRGHIVDIIMGIKSEKIIAWKHHEKIKTFGKGFDFFPEESKEFWKYLSGQLISSSHLILNIENHGVLEISPKGLNLLYGKESFVCRKPRQHKFISKTSKPKIEETHYEYDKGLFKLLKELRLEIARENSVPAFVIFSDRTLIDIASLKPSNEAELLSVNGVGSVKMQRYGKRFINCVSDFNKSVRLVINK